MCEICHQHPCPSGCPNAEEPKPVKICDWCRGEIYVGDTYYKIAGEDVCEDCVDECKSTAEEEEPDYEDEN